MKTAAEKIQAAIAIFKASLPEARGKFRPMVSERNGNEVEFFTDGILYCTVNTRNRMIKGI